MTTINALKRVFSGIQPTGVPHIGNYFGALALWRRIADEKRIELKDPELSSQVCDKPIYSIVDVHAYSSTSQKLGKTLYDSILTTTASLLALGLTSDKCVLFRQSDVLEHFYLDNVLDNFITTGSLLSLNQYKDKKKKLDGLELHNGLLNYPVLQAADILLYRAPYVPIGADQMEHIELTRDIAKKFNSYFKTDLFPLIVPVMNESEHCQRIRSLREPTKKMSKSDTQTRSIISIVDEPDVIVANLKKAVTDCTSEIYYDANGRPGVSNLMRIYHSVSGENMQSIEQRFSGKNTGEFKLALADALIEYFKPTRTEYKKLVQDRCYIERVLKCGADEARDMAQETVKLVKNLIGSTSAN